MSWVAINVLPDKKKGNISIKPNCGNSSQAIERILAKNALLQKSKVKDVYIMKGLRKHQDPKGSAKNVSVIKALFADNSDNYCAVTCKEIFVVWIVRCFNLDTMQNKKNVFFFEIIGIILFDITVNVLFLIHTHQMYSSSTKFAVYF